MVFKRKKLAICLGVVLAGGMLISYGYTARVLPVLRLVGHVESMGGSWSGDGLPALGFAPNRISFSDRMVVGDEGAREFTRLLSHVRGVHSVYLGPTPVAAEVAGSMFGQPGLSILQVAVGREADLVKTFDRPSSVRTLYLILDGDHQNTTDLDARLRSKGVDLHVEPSRRP